MMDEIEENPMYALLGMVEAFEPMIDAANGLRNKMVEQGFSPASAEDVAREFLICCMRKALA